MNYIREDKGNKAKHLLALLLNGPPTLAQGKGDSHLAPRGDFITQGTVDNFYRQSAILIVTTKTRTVGIWWAEDREAAQHPGIHRSLPHHTQFTIPKCHQSRG
jgi:hypothetical protein